MLRFLLSLALLLSLAQPPAGAALPTPMRACAPCPEAADADLARLRDFMQQGSGMQLMGRLVHNTDAQSAAAGGHFELYVHAATLAPAYELRFSLENPAERAALAQALARHRAARRGSFFVLLRCEAASLQSNAEQATLTGIRASDILPLEGGTDTLDRLFRLWPELESRLPRHPHMRDSWDWD